MERRKFIKTSILLADNVDRSRRNFCLKMAGGLAGVMLAPTFACRLLAEKPEQPYIREARYYRKLDGKNIQCQLCPKSCIVSPGQRGYCRVRENRDGIYQTLVYGRLCTINLDPIEKKPLFHFLPGTTAVSVATAGCNVQCKFCQNWNIAQVKPEDISFEYLSPEALVGLTKSRQSPTIAFTYNEPTVFTEYILDTAAVAKQRGIHSVMISNGFIQKQPLLDLCKVLSAYKVDFKAFSEKFYSEVVSGSMKPVLDTMVRIKEQGVWLEIVNLVIPTQNDDRNSLRELSRWVVNNLGIDTPVHFTRFHPQYRMNNLPPTPTRTLETAYEIAREAGIRYVYVGNIPQNQKENTYCHHCGNLLIERAGFFINSNKITDGKCGSCQTKIPGIWR
ncbi:MAG: AmmeMemoRadiSam system radical SAM enzyme [Candidatus Neomarinimicrobiota bacterium]